MAAWGGSVGSVGSGTVLTLKGVGPEPALACATSQPCMDSTERIRPSRARHTQSAMPVSQRPPGTDTHGHSLHAIMEEITHTHTHKLPYSIQGIVGILQSSLLYGID